MKLTQTIKNWLHKMFAWWPWKQTTQIEYSHVANPLNKGTTQETASRSMIDGIAPQTGIVSSPSTVEDRPERIAQSDFTAAGELAEAPSLSSKTSGDGPIAAAHTSPSPQQRLEFLQYLIQRGIVNEGFNEEK